MSTDNVKDLYEEDTTEAVPFDSPVDWESVWNKSAEPVGQFRGVVHDARLDTAKGILRFEYEIKGGDSDGCVVGRDYSFSQPVAARMARRLVNQLSGKNVDAATLEAVLPELVGRPVQLNCVLNKGKYYNVDVV